LPVQRLGRGCDGETSGECSGAELGRATTWCEDGTDGNVFDEVRVDLRAFEEGLESASEEVGCLRVLEATLSALCDGSTESACYDDLMEVLAKTLYNIFSSGCTIAPRLQDSSSNTGALYSHHQHASPTSSTFPSSRSHSTIQYHQPYDPRPARGALEL
jgi:hypothetical protein